MKVPLLQTGLTGFVVLAGCLSFRAWRGLEGIGIGTHGLIALGLGVFCTIVLGWGLMYLVFYNSRNGYDDLVD